LCVLAKWSRSAASCGDDEAARLPGAVARRVRARPAMAFPAVVGRRSDTAVRARMGRMRMELTEALHGVATPQAADVALAGGGLALVAARRAHRMPHLAAHLPRKPTATPTLARRSLLRQRWCCCPKVPPRPQRTRRRRSVLASLWLQLDPDPVMSLSVIFSL
jgi:hypothetical protein